MTRALVISTALIAALTLPAMAEPGTPGAQFMHNWDVNEDGHVSLAEALDKREAIFAAFDANENGTLDAEEYAILDEARDHEPQGGHGQGRHGTQGQGKGNGQGMGRGMGQGGGQGAGRGQGQGQGQGQGRGATMQPMGIGAGLAMDRDQVDLNDDGIVTHEEFVSSVKSWFAEKDQDGDGLLSPADFTRR